MAADAKALLDKAIEELATAVESPSTAARVGAFLATMARFHKYSVGNQILIAFQRPETTVVAGYETWKKVKRQVKKGEKGIAILAPCPYNKTVKKDDGTEEDRSGMFFRTVFVFDVAQTDGPELASVISNLDGDYDRLVGALEAFCASRSIRVEEYALTPGTWGASFGGSIALKLGMSSARRFLTLAHEVAHEILHKDDACKALTKQEKETDAEAVAFTIGLHYKIVQPESATYLKLYGVDAKLLRARYNAISKAVKEILEGLETAGTPAAQAA